MGNFWSFIVTHFKNAWTAIAQWFQRPHKMTLVGAVIFLMLALVLSSALVVDNLFIGSVHRDPRLDTLFQLTAYVSQSTVIVFMIAFALAGLCLLYATVRVHMAQARVKSRQAEAKVAYLDAKITILHIAEDTAAELAVGMQSGKYAPEVAMPLIVAANDIVMSNEPSSAVTKGTPQLDTEGRDSSRQLTIPAPEHISMVNESLSAGTGEGTQTALHPESAEIEEGRLGD